MLQYSPMDSIPALARLLLEKRGITGKDEALKFLYPDYERDLLDPFLMDGMERAVKRIFKAIKKKERVAIWGDYDCDGIPGSVILGDFFKKIGYKNYTHYIPHRHKEGYGMNCKGIDLLAKEGSKLIITVDSGITDLDSVEHSNSLNIDVIITDHHLPGEKLPDAYAIINNKKAGDNYEFKFLSGSGTVWKLVCALFLWGRKKKILDVPLGFEKWLLDLAGLATIADMVPLVGENRVIAYYGLKVLQQTKRPGLRALLAKARVNLRDLSEEDVGFCIGPRINAASRMGEPIDALRLLSADDISTAEPLAEHLEKLNNSRKSSVAKMIEEVEQLLGESPTSSVIVAGSENWSPGVVGLAASRIVERYGKSAFVWGGLESEELRGSCRSDGTVNIVALMASAPAGTFAGFGGHEAAGGFSVARGTENKLLEIMSLAYDVSEKIDTQGAKKSSPDTTLYVEDVNWNNYKLIQMLAPFGMGNPKPLFLFEDIVVENSRMFGKMNEHLELTLSQNGSLVKAIKFFAGRERAQRSGARISLLAHIEKDTFRHPATLRLKIVEIIER